MIWGLQVWSLDRVGDFVDEIITGRYKVPYYVRARSDYDRQYPPTTYDRYCP
jgi:hypothetical protein